MEISNKITWDFQLPTTSFPEVAHVFEINDDSDMLHK